jgi:HK97 family phage major capsid protein
VENVVRDLLLREFANVEDKALLQGTGANFAPKGLRYLAKTVNAATSTPTNAQIAADLLGLVSALTAANVPMLAPTWFMTNTAREFLLTLPSSSGVFQFPDVSAGTLMGYPVASSTSVPSGVVILADMSQFLLGQSELTVTLMPGATYTNSAGTRVSAFDTDTSVIKLVMGIDCALKHDEAAACLVSASWG